MGPFHGTRPPGHHRFARRRQPANAGLAYSRHAHRMPRHAGRMDLADRAHPRRHHPRHPQPGRRPAARRRDLRGRAGPLADRRGRRARRRAGAGPPARARVVDPPAHLGRPGHAGVLPRRRLRERALVALGPRPRRAVCRVAASAPASPPRARGPAARRVARRGVGGVRGRGPGRDAAHGIPGGARADLVPRGLRGRLRRRAGHPLAVGAARLVVGRRRGAARRAGRPGEHRHRPAVGRASPTTSWCGPPCTSSATRGSTGGWPARGAAVAAGGRRRGGTGGAGVGGPLPGVDDRPRRRRGEQLLPDPGDPGVPRDAAGRRRARRWSRCSPGGWRGRGPGRAWCWSAAGS